MEVSLREIEPQSRSVVENLFQYYVYDMSEFMGWPPNDSGLYSFNPSLLDAYWAEEDHFPHFIYVDSELAGFALVRRYPSNPAIYDMEQFFVLRKFKGKGVGKLALKSVLERFPGRWQIRVLVENTAALGFWTAAVLDVVGSEYTLSLQNDVDLMMNFIQFDV
ncbi:GNAT family N-acetyltransferase [Photobacterium sp. OFAV2-7]|uniref:GNAT family N-acetyltransferase n=1 Tax=Photobacterium sp. OFAV2-7 TaxID=2917748 RepID=UPI001EF61195|nr:GNAT family N-acetyltransferase [Photobacterium sp. OFAV2-7]MCG7585380.1 GNAT family N-acetyltransferase [Photobacterium sp. OFAV2-7]